MKRHRISTKPFQKRVEDMVKNLEASFKQEDSLTRKEIICYVVFCIGIGIGLNLNLIMIYVGYPLDLCGLTPLGNAHCSLRILQRIRPRIRTRIRPSIRLHFIFCNPYTCHPCGNDCAHVQKRNNCILLDVFPFDTYCDVKLLYLFE